MQILEKNKIYLESGVESAFFYGDTLSYRVVASTVSGGFIPVGRDISDVLGIGHARLGAHLSGTDKPIAVNTQRGIGIIFPLFYISSGLYTFVRISSRRASVKRVLNYLSENGFCVLLDDVTTADLRDEDIPTCRAVQSVISSFASIEEYTSGDYMRAASGFTTDSFDVEIDAMEQLLRELADFIGIEISAKQAAGTETYATAQDMRTLICTQLLCLAVAKTHAVGDVDITVNADGGVWSIQIQFLCRKAENEIGADAKRYLELTADITGTKFFSYEIPAPKPAGKRGEFLRVKLVNVYTPNPDVGIAWDVKAGRILKY